MKIHIPTLALLLPALAFVAAPQGEAKQDAPPSTQPAEAGGSAVPDRAEDVEPLETGEAAADAEVRTAEGEAVSLGDLYGQGPTMLVFYRGGWCPYCNAQLSALAEAQPKIRDMGFQILAISPDRPETLKESLEENQFQYRLLSDSDMTASRAFGLAFRVADETVEQYRGFGIDLENASGQDHQLLPVPAIYLIDREGAIRFVHWDPDYKNRLDAEALLTAARSVVRKEPGQ